MQFKTALTIVHRMAGMHKLYVRYLEHRCWTVEVEYTLCNEYYYFLL